MQFAVIEVFARMAAARPDPDAVLATALTEFDREATRYSATGPAGTKETATVIAQVRAGGSRRLASLRAVARRSPR